MKENRIRPSSAEQAIFQVYGMVDELSLSIENLDEKIDGIRDQHADLIKQVNTLSVFRETATFFLKAVWAIVIPLTVAVLIKILRIA